MDKAGVTNSRPARAEQSSGSGVPGGRLQRAVGDVASSMAARSGVSNRSRRVGTSSFPRRRARFDIDVTAIREMNRNRLAEFAHFDRHAVVFDQQPDLLCKIGAEKGRVVSQVVA